MKYSEKQKQFSQLAEKIRANPRRTLRMCSKIRNFTGREISFKENYQTKIDWKSSSVSNYKPIKTNILFQKLQILNIPQSQPSPILSETLPCLAPWKGEQKLEGKQFSEENHKEGDQNHREFCFFFLVARLLPPLLLLMRTKCSLTLSNQFFYTTLPTLRHTLTVHRRAILTVDQQSYGSYLLSISLRHLRPVTCLLRPLHSITDGVNFLTESSTSL